MKLKKNPTVQEAVEFLENRKDIVKYLETHGFTDDIPESDNRIKDCPVARWLQKVTGNQDIMVGVVEVFVPGEESIWLSDRLVSAISYFDHHRLDS